MRHPQPSFGVTVAVWPVPLQSFTLRNPLLGQIAIAKASQDELKLLEEAARKMNDCFNDLASQVMEVREETSAGLVLLLGVQAACPHFTTRVKKRGYII